MRGRPSHAAQRAIQQLTIGVAKSTQARAAREAELGMAETFQQYQVPVSGTAGTTPTFVTVTVTFDFPFHYAPGQRDSDLEKPHLGVGFDADGNVMITAGVVEWYTDSDTGAYTGADVAIGVLAAVTGWAFSGNVHLTFQGFSAPDDTGDLTVES